MKELKKGVVAGVAFVAVGHAARHSAKSPSLAEPWYTKAHVEVEGPVYPAYLHQTYAAITTSGTLGASTTYTITSFGT